MIKVPLTREQIAIIDDEDWNLIKDYNWYAKKSRNTFYAQAYVIGSNRKGRKTISMHRLIIGAQPGQQVDHKNGDGLDNRRFNLRLVTNAQNSMNRKKVGGTSQYKGVCFDKNRNKWQSYIRINYKRIHLGRFLTEIEAAKRYDEAAIKYFGEFARLNFPKEVYHEQ